MNKTFAEHVTQTAFFLSISKKQIGYLQHILTRPWPSREYYDHTYFVSGTLANPDNWIGSFSALVRKGLLVWVFDDVEYGKGHYELTKAGKLTCELLKEAGLIAETAEVAA